MSQLYHDGNKYQSLYVRIENPVKENDIALDYIKSNEESIRSHSPPLFTRRFFQIFNRPLEASVRMNHLLKRQLTRLIQLESRLA